METGDYILGIALLGHDLSMTVVDDNGQVCFVAEEERYSRIKGGRFVFHPDLVLTILRSHVVDPGQIKTIAIAGMPQTWPGNGLTNLAYSPEARSRHLAAWIRVLRERFPLLEQLVQVRHHRAHAASAYLASRWNEAAVVTADGFGDGEVAAIFAGVGGEMRFIKAIPFPHSVAYLNEAFASWVGLTGRERAGKLMALAAYGQPSHMGYLRQALTGGVRDKFKVCAELERGVCNPKGWLRVLEEILGPAREQFEPIEQCHMDLAASMQAILEDELLHLAKEARNLTGFEYCCFGGGAFLNSLANRRIVESEIFTDIFVQPMANDSGLSLGAALLASQAAGRPRWRMEHAYLGDDLDIARISQEAKRQGVMCSEVEDVVEWAVSKLVASAVIGWCQGRSEVGPRALGHRSLFADPRNPNMASRLNAIKRREIWRPFAPMILEEDVPLWLDRPRRLPYMTEIHKIRNADRIPAAVHIDGTARIQTVSREVNPMLHELLHRFKVITGVGAVLNTSLNIRGRPIALKTEDCIEFLKHTTVDAIVIGNFVLERNESVPFYLPIDVKPLDQLPNTYILATFDGEIGSLIDRLHMNAERKIVLLQEEIFHTDVISRLTEIGQNPIKPLVVALPWYLNVCIETLPRLMAKILTIIETFESVCLVDPLGCVRDAKLFLAGQEANLLLQTPLTDVEIHFRNRTN